MVAIKDADFSNVDAVFCCLPHGTTQVTFYSITSSDLFIKTTPEGILTLAS